MRSPRTNPYIWSFTTYFAEGFPYSLIRIASSFFFRDCGASLEAVGLTSLFGLPWILKFLWAPSLDQYTTKRTWLLLTQGMLAVLILLVACLTPFSWATPAIALLFFIGAVFAATHDIAIDGFYLEALDKEEQAKFVGYRVMAYRIALMTGSGIIITLGAAINWFTAFFLSALILAGLFLFHTSRLPRCETEKKSLNLRQPLCSFPFLLGLSLVVCLIFFLRTIPLFDLFYQADNLPLFKICSLSSLVGLLLFLSLCVAVLFRKKLQNHFLNNSKNFFSRSFLSFIDRKHITAIILFIILIRTGEFMITSMLAPFMIDLGIKTHYGWISAGVGLPCSILGALAGGMLISRYSLTKMIWPFLLAQNITNLIYMGLARHLQPLLELNSASVEPIFIGTNNLLAVACVNGFDQLAGGLGTAVLMTFLMGICKKEFKAAHYAIGTGLMNISGLYGGVLSGFLASWLGYSNFFGISFILSIPGMILIFFLPGLEKKMPNPD